MENREIKTVDIHQVLEMAEKTKESLLERLAKRSS